MENHGDEFKDFETLQKLIQQGDAPSLKQQLLKSTSGVECKDDIGNTPLLQAAYFGKSDCVEILLEIGRANYEVINVFGQNAVTLASYVVSTDCIKLLLTAYKNYTESSLLPPLCVAAMKGHLEIVNLFCQLTPSPNLIQSAHGILTAIISFRYICSINVTYIPKHDERGKCGKFATDWYAKASISSALNF